MKRTIIFAGVLVVIVLIVGSKFVAGYNRAIRMDEEVKERWAQVENQLQRRYDLIPNLVETVKGLAAQEKDVFLGVAEARKAYFQAEGVNAKADAASGVERALSRLLVLRETYPQLKSNEAFNKLQDQLEGSENRLAVERMRYNDAVRDLNAYVRGFPGNLVSGVAGIKEAEYFEIEAEAKSAPKVEFGAATGAPLPVGAR